MRKFVSQSRRETSSVLFRRIFFAFLLVILLQKETCSDDYVLAFADLCVPSNCPIYFWELGVLHEYEIRHHLEENYTSLKRKSTIPRGNYVGSQILKRVEM